MRKCVFFYNAPRPERCSLEGDIVQTGISLPFIGRFQRGFQRFYCATQIMHSAYLLWRRGWVAGCPSHAGIVSKRLNLSENFFRLYGRYIILVSSDPCADTQFQAEPFQQGVKYTGVGKIGHFRAIFEGNRCLSRKWCEIVRWLLRNVNRKSWVPD